MNKQESTICINKEQLTGAIYSHLLVEFGYGYFEKSLQTVAENLAEDIIRKQSYTEKMGDVAE
ncbi:hypothetical protein phi9181_ORF088 [Enterococcus phage 9181]|nr:hypothetical protein phi9181_ORF088 [Enterococcus phage 9181]